MIVSVANSISRAQQGLTWPVPQSSANKPPFAKLFSFSANHFNPMICWDCNCMGLSSGVKIPVSMAKRNTDIESSKFSFGNSWLSVSSANLQENISLIFIFRKWLSSNDSSDSNSNSSFHSGSGNSSDGSSDISSHSGWTLTTALTAALTAALTVAELWQQLWQ